MLKDMWWKSLSLTPTHSPITYTHTHTWSSDSAIMRRHEWQCVFYCSPSLAFSQSLSLSPSVWDDRVPCWFLRDGELMLVTFFLALPSEYHPYRVGPHSTCLELTKYSILGNSMWSMAGRGVSWFAGRSATAGPCQLNITEYTMNYKRMLEEHVRPICKKKKRTLQSDSDPVHEHIYVYKKRSQLL